MQVERYISGCEPPSLTFCHLHAPESGDYVYVQVIHGRQSGKTAALELLDVLERGDQRHQNPGEQAECQ